MPAVAPSVGVAPPPAVSVPLPAVAEVPPPSIPQPAASVPPSVVARAPVTPPPSTAPPVVAAPSSPVVEAIGTLPVPPGSSAPPLVGSPELTAALAAAQAAARAPAAPARAPTPARLIVRNLASVSLTSLPNGAEVHIDGVRRGVTPLLLRDLGPGRHEVRLVKPGQIDEKVSVLLPGGQVTRLSNPLPAPARLTVLGYPAGAAIAVSGLAYEPGMPLPPGMVAIVVILPGGGERTQRVELQPGDNAVDLTAQ